MSESLAVTFLGRDLITPLVLPAGVVGMSHSSLKDIAGRGAGMVTSKSFTSEPRDGHRGPVVAEFDGGLMNCMGLCNPGIEEGLEELAKYRARCTTPVIASVFATSPSGFEQLAAKVNPSHADFLELNLSCPNVHEEFGAPLSNSPELVSESVKRSRNVTDLQVIAKLTPNTSQITVIAEAAAAGGAHGLCLINTVGPGMAIDVRASRPVLSNVVGGMSGPAIKPIALRCVYEARRATGLPIIGMGGVQTGTDVIEMLMAGASVVGVGTAVYYRGVDVFAELCRELTELLAEMGHASVSEIRQISVEVAS